MGVVVLPALTALLTLACIWIVVPPFSLPLLIAAVVAIETSPYQVLLNLAVLWYVVSSWKKEGRRLALGLTCLNLALTALPAVTFLASSRDPQLLLRAFEPEDRTFALVERDIATSGQPGGRTFHAYLPQGSPRTPVVMSIYGGAWQRGGPANDAVLNRSLAARGYAVFALDYRHSPQYRFPAALEDVKAQIAFLMTHAAEYGADPTRVAIIGHSSGGELAMLAAFARGSPFRSVISYSGGVDLAKGYEVPPNPDPIGIRQVILEYVGVPPDKAAAAYLAASPLAQVRRGLPPVLLVYAKRDHVVDIRSAWKLRDALRARDDEVTFLEFPLADHAFENVPFGLHARIARRATLDFLERTLR